MPLGERPKLMEKRFQDYLKYLNQSDPDVQRATCKSRVQCAPALAPLGQEDRAWARSLSGSKAELARAMAQKRESDPDILRATCKSRLQRTPAVAHVGQEDRAWARSLSGSRAELARAMAQKRESDPDVPRATCKSREQRVPAVVTVVKEKQAWPTSLSGSIARLARVTAQKREPDRLRPLGAVYLPGIVHRPGIVLAPLKSSSDDRQKTCGGKVVVPDEKPMQTRKTILWYQDKLQHQDEPQSRAVFPPVPGRRNQLSANGMRYMHPEPPLDIQQQALLRNLNRKRRTVIPDGCGLNFHRNLPALGIMQ
ncbi:uncharacterized protein LOC142159058 [Mixophyes fleayi]|uniref:uncharacterized protein LOC142159058 n=1 Tax=Mixophyes fleayi TaxID=3061075 RepID=UPI003F4E312D